MTSLIDSIIKKVLPTVSKENQDKISKTIDGFIKNPEKDIKSQILSVFLTDFFSKNKADGSSSVEDIFKNTFNITPENLTKMRNLGLDISSIFGGDSKSSNFKNFVGNSPFSHLAIYAAIISAVLKYGLADKVKSSFSNNQTTDDLKFMLTKLGDIQDDMPDNKKNDLSVYFAELIRLYWDDKNKTVDQNSAAKQDIISLFSNQDFLNFLAKKTKSGELINIIALSMPSSEHIYKFFQEASNNAYKQSLSDQEIVSPNLTDLDIEGVLCSLICSFKDLNALSGDFKIPVELIKKALLNSRENGYLIFYHASVDGQNAVFAYQSTATTNTSEPLRWSNYETYLLDEIPSLKTCFIENRLRKAISI